MITLGCLHTAQSNITIFEQARERLRDDDYQLTHQVHSHLLLQAEQAGSMTPAPSRCWHRSGAGATGGGRSTYIGVMRRRHGYPVYRSRGGHRRTR
ncbi:hypothetical protein SGGMMB4_03327 [Sodalis glossinidius str. 'morsitans']|uniref:Uncharacterized protein n=1 Tax=Sodalis glossinidius (strain morsitans) TaxID=343509 RepID=A0A193QKT0_SODGM|nr:hypothetical protein SGGMMB4_03327 [Sodalis glossinidius str. 'morsitans']